jgi:hypothetical protein
MARAQTLGLALERRVIKSSLRSVGTLSRPYETVFRLARHEFKLALPQRARARAAL